MPALSQDFAVVGTGAHYVFSTSAGEVRALQKTNFNSVSIS